VREQACGGRRWPPCCPARPSCTGPQQRRGSVCGDSRDAGARLSAITARTCKGRLPHVDVADKRLRGGAQIDDLTFVMSQEEIEQGMTLLCMTRPVSDVTVETQSDWGYSLGVGEWKGPTGHILGAPLTLVLNLTNSRPPGGHALASVPVPIFRTGMQTARGLVRPARAAESAGPPLRDAAGARRTEQGCSCKCTACTSVPHALGVGGALRAFLRIAAGRQGPQPPHDMIEEGGRSAARSAAPALDTAQDGRRRSCWRPSACHAAPAGPPRAVRLPCARRGRRKNS